MGSDMPDHGFGRCDGHHEMVDFSTQKNRCPPKISNQKD
jgi:hypothetical protein